MSETHIATVGGDDITRDRLKSRGFTDSACTVMGHVRSRTVARALFGRVPILMVIWAMLRWEDKIGSLLISELCGDRWSLEKDLDIALEAYEHNESRTAALDGNGKYLDLGEIANAAAVAEEESRALGHNYVATEHLVLALCGVDDPLLRPILEKHAISYERARNLLLTMI